MSISRFISTWQSRGYERGESQTFWLTLLRDVLGVPQPETLIRFEEHARIDQSGFIDAVIPSTRVLIEQKSVEKDLRAPIPQSDGSALTPFQQANRYRAQLPYNEQPRWIVCCNFREFLIYDMNTPHAAPASILLSDLEREAYRLRFLVDTKSEHIKKEEQVSKEAGRVVAALYDLLLQQYRDPSAPSTLHSLNVLCVRLVFCLYAEDALLFGRRDAFHDYLAAYTPAQMRRALIELFHTLNTPIAERDPYLEPTLAAFPYVNGGLFADDNIEIPQFTPEMAHRLLQNASLDFDWTDISPTIFGAVFESTLNPETRRAGGMHYTSIENIHRLIDPLFLDDLRAEFDAICAESLLDKRNRRLDAFHERLASLRFLDPACGSGNFLTETYVSLRRLENELIRLRHQGQTRLGLDIYNPVRVSIAQFYGIEINDFAISVARTALWIAEAQMLAETKRIYDAPVDYFPLRHYDNLHEADALSLPWEDVIDPARLSYIIGNPPFVGYSMQSREQKEAMLRVYVDERGKPYKTAGKIDFVAGWYMRAAQMMAQNKTIRTALVSTNSITQGEQVASVWEPLYKRYGVHIDFAYRTFRWDSESHLKAAVHVVIVGFSCAAKPAKAVLYNEAGYPQEVENINAYLTAAPDIFIQSRAKPICDGVVPMVYGNKPVDGGNFFLTETEYADFIAREPKAAKFIRRVYGAEEFINNKVRYCLWLKEATPAELRAMPAVYQRVQAVRDMRLASSKEATRLTADTPTLWQEDRQPETDYIIVPRVSSERRRYVPMGFMTADTVVNDSVQIIPSATLYHFGVLTSNVHMAWMRAVCGRLKSDYRYSKDIVYNNFPWPQPTPEQEARIAETAQQILDARALYPDSSLADLYDETLMPAPLRRAHQQNDRAVMQAYGFHVSRDFTEPHCVAALMELYQQAVKA